MRTNRCEWCNQYFSKMNEHTIRECVDQQEWIVWLETLETNFNYELSTVEPMEMT